MHTPLWMQLCVLREKIKNKLWTLDVANFFTGEIFSQKIMRPLLVWFTVVVFTQKRLVIISLFHGGMQNIITVILYFHVVWHNSMDAVVFRYSSPRTHFLISLETHSSFQYTFNEETNNPHDLRFIALCCYLFRIKTKKTTALNVNLCFCYVIGVKDFYSFACWCVKSLLLYISAPHRRLCNLLPAYQAVIGQLQFLMWATPKVLK